MFFLLAVSEIIRHQSLEYQGIGHKNMCLLRVVRKRLNIKIQEIRDICGCRLVKT